MRGVEGTRNLIILLAKQVHSQFLPPPQIFYNIMSKNLIQKKENLKFFTLEALLNTHT